MKPGSKQSVMVGRTAKLAIGPAWPWRNSTIAITALCNKRWWNNHKKKESQAMATLVGHLLYMPSPAAKMQKYTPVNRKPIAIARTNSFNQRYLQCNSAKSKTTPKATHNTPTPPISRLEMRPWLRRQILYTTQAMPPLTAPKNNAKSLGCSGASELPRRYEVAHITNRQALTTKCPIACNLRCIFKRDTASSMSRKLWPLP
mmetsp:Transcript_121931/g.352137  ORF Transcript_121931/g.352137 Transcript_121931/m.352137 type:complete len:202 (+) Transcript_121931:285-890(+)